MGAGVPGVKRGEESIWCIICCSIYTAKLRKEGVLGFEVYISAHRCALKCLCDTVEQRVAPRGSFLFPEVCIKYQCVCLEVRAVVESAGKVF